MIGTFSQKLDRGRRWERAKELKLIHSFVNWRLLRREQSEQSELSQHCLIDKPHNCCHFSQNYHLQPFKLILIQNYNLFSQLAARRMIRFSPELELSSVWTGDKKCPIRQTIYHDHANTQKYTEIAH